MSNSSEHTTAGPQVTMDLSGIQSADLIFMRTESSLITGSTCAEFSHVMLATEPGRCIEAVTDGVQGNRLIDALKDATYAALYRHKSIDANYASWVVYTAEQFRKVNTPYDYAGAAQAGLNSGCSPVPVTSLNPYMSGMQSATDRWGNHDKAFFCSELVARCYQLAHLPVTDWAPYKVTPGALSESPYLNFVKDVVAVI